MTTDIKTDKKLIITNNPKVQKEWQENSILTGKFHLVFFDSREEIFTEVRNLIHSNWMLINHAMAGNIPLHKHPYRSMALEKGDKLDTKSLLLWESATERVNRGKCPPYSKEILEDFQELDFQLFSDSINKA